MARFTVSEVAEELEVERETARGLVKFMSETGVVELKGERTHENGRTKEKLYAFVGDADRKMNAMVKKLVQKW